MNLSLAFWLSNERRHEICQGILFVQLFPANRKDVCNRIQEFAGQRETDNVIWCKSNGEIPKLGMIWNNELLAIASDFFLLTSSRDKMIRQRQPLSRSSNPLFEKRRRSQQLVSRSRVRWQAPSRVGPEIPPATVQIRNSEVLSKPTMHTIVPLPGCVVFGRLVVDQSLCFRVMPGFLCFVSEAGEDMLERAGDWSYPYRQRPRRSARSFLDSNSWSNPTFRWYDPRCPRPLKFSVVSPLFFQRPPASRLWFSDLSFVESYEQHKAGKVSSRPIEVSKTARTRKNATTSWNSHRPRPLKPFLTVAEWTSKEESCERCFFILEKRMKKRRSARYVGY